MALPCNEFWDFLIFVTIIADDIMVRGLSPHPQFSSQRMMDK